MSEKTAEYLLKPFRVIHNNGDVIDGFNTLADAQENAQDRNDRAKTMGLSCVYRGVAKP